MNESRSCSLERKLGHDRSVDRTQFRAVVIAHIKLASGLQKCHKKPEVAKKLLKYNNKRVSLGWHSLPVFSLKKICWRHDPCFGGLRPSISEFRTKLFSYCKWWERGFHFRSLDQRSLLLSARLYVLTES